MANWNCHRRGSQLGLDKLGLTAEACGDTMVELAERSQGLAGKFLRWISPEIEDSKKKSDAANAQKIADIMKRGLSEKEAKSAVAGAEKEKISVAQYLNKMGKMGTAAQTKEATKGSTVGVEAMNKANRAESEDRVKGSDVIIEKQNVDRNPLLAAMENRKRGVGIEKSVEPNYEYKKKTPISTTPMVPEVASALKVTRQEAIGMTANARDAEKAKADDSKRSETTTPTATAAAQSPSGSFVGGVNGDGSITFKLDNFMPVFAQASTMVKQKSSHGPFG